MNGSSFGTGDGKESGMSVAHPVHYDEGAPSRLEEGIGLCLSGGGYRAMLFHLGSLWRLHEANLLSQIDRISSVSGGSITAAVLGHRWQQDEQWFTRVVSTIRALARHTIDVSAGVSGILIPGVSIGERVARAYDKHLFEGATLQELPNKPRFVINATNLQSGALWRFMKPYMRDWRVGEVRNPRIPLATAVAASSAFPPFLSPTVLHLREGEFTPNSGALQRPPYTTKVILSDGGVYDNLGLETVFKKYRTVLVSDAGAAFDTTPTVTGIWPGHTLRVLGVIDNQVRSLRKRQLIATYLEPPTAPARRGAYWGINSDPANYELVDALPVSATGRTRAANVPTRLAKLDDDLQELLINWGYAATDTAIRKHVNANLPKGKYPYERGV